MDKLEIKEFIIDSINTCRSQGIKPTSKFWNVYPTITKVTTVLDGLVTDSYEYPENSVWSCREKETCDVLECLLVVHQPTPRKEMFHFDYLREILGVDNDWLNSFYKGFDSWKEEASIKEAFELGKEIKNYLKNK